MNINFSKSSDGLVPAIIQDNITSKVLMLGYMNQEAIDKTISTGLVTFFSRSKNRMWTKGEESGNFLHYISVSVDCDQDSLLIKANPVGPVCHTGADTCWNELNTSENFLIDLEKIIESRKLGTDEKSYVKSLFNKGINSIAQKVGEEAVELVIEAKDNDDDKFINEAADLIFHFLILLNIKNFTLQQVIDVLQKRHKK
ncbi:MAG: bifunctional phosphoribosyl-AMP cyclohydrolase/phosphoribosyl-ATP diphosphatase HisIE [Chitinophagaceae bacterium]|nr:bifunctional phosphoribosyl-AMP cyclohydrolase/phosphoribosyl-ATP diphosphatase HisIE [Chitinophagaceae bacterium]